MCRINYSQASIESLSVLSETGAEGRVSYPVGEHDSLESVYRQLAVIPVQTHSLNVGVVENRDDEFPDTDALVTFRSALPIGVRTADCVPILLYAPDVRAVAAIHAGWRGTLGGIVENTVQVLVNHGADPAQMIAAFGPSISKEMYEVDHDLARKFIDAGFSDHISYPGVKPHIDLQGINIARLINNGLSRSNIHPFPGCTYTTTDATGHPLFPSHRRTHGSPARLLTHITLT